MKTERQGKSFGRQCWKNGMNVQETLEAAALECGLEALPDNPAKWPKFVHGAEECWQDKNLAWLDQRNGLKTIHTKHFEEDKEEP